jgi:hypothetical protein
MAATLLQSDFTYRSGIPSEAYTYTVVQDQSGTLGIRNVQSPRGLIIDAFTKVPQSVIDDMNTSLQQVEDILASTSDVNGTLVFTAEASKAFIFATPLTGTSYRVQLTTDSFVPLRVISKTTAGFTVEAGATFTGSVGFDVFL